MDKILADQRKRSQGVIGNLENEYEAVRTSQATPALLNHVMVDAYGQEMPINQLATVATSEGRHLLVTPWDQSVLPAIEKAILTSDLGLTPSSDGQTIRLTIPQLTEERRQEISKQVSKRAEEARVAIRNIRRDAISTIEKREKTEGWSEDEVERGKKEAQEITDEFIEKIDEMAEAKTAEVMTL